MQRAKALAVAISLFLGLLAGSVFLGCGGEGRFEEAREEAKDEVGDLKEDAEDELDDRT